jgi:hypothetical protein
VYFSSSVFPRAESGVFSCSLAATGDKKEPNDTISASMVRRVLFLRVIMDWVIGWF